MAKPIGKHQKNMYNFLKEYPGKWHSYSKDSLTKRTVSSLKKKKLLCTNKFNQMKLREGRC